MKKFVFVLMLVFSLCLFVGCGEKEEDKKTPTPEDPTEDVEKKGLERIKNSGYLVLGFTDFQPFGYIEDGKYYGFDLELAALVAEELGVKLTPKYIDWDAQVLELQENVDCIWNAMTITEKRKENMIFTKPYWETNLVAVVKADSEMTKVEDIKGKKISVEANGTADINLSGNEDYKVSQYTTVSDARIAVDSGQADAFVADATYVQDILTKYSDQYKVLDGTIGDIEEYGVAFRQGEEDLRDEVDKIIDKLYEEGKIDELLAKYFGEGNGFKR